MKSKDLLIELIEYLDRYENENVENELNLSDFIGFLNNNYETSNVKAKQLNGNYEGYSFEEQKGSTTDISILIATMFRYAKNYIKKALKDSIIKTPDEFSVLITLMTFDSLKKTELIQKQVMEKTSGIEIINRLIKLQLIEQFDDSEDKRSQRVKMTQSGREEMMKILPQMRIVSQLVAGNLTEIEKTSLAYLLRKLDVFHNDIFLNKKDVTLSELLKGDI